MNDFLVIGGFWFYSLILIELIFLFIFISTENGVWATISLAAVITALCFFGDFNLITFLTENPLRLCAIVGTYIIAGIAWSAFRFYWYYSKEVQKLVDNKERWVNTRPSQFDKTLNSPEARKAWNDHIDENSPYVRDCKAKIINWLAYWPISVVCFFLSDFLAEFFVHLYNRLVGFYESIAASIKQRAKLE